jgi:hypothetical protein
MLTKVSLQNGQQEAVYLRAVVFLVVLIFERLPHIPFYTFSKLIHTQNYTHNHFFPGKAMALLTLKQTILKF